MKQYLEKLDSHLSNIQQAAREEDDSYRSRIFWNYLHHGALELGGDWERIFTPELTIEEPHYEMRTDSAEPIVLDGGEVEEFYAAIEDENMMLVDDGNHQLFANDEGLAEFATTVEFTTGQAILDDGLDNWYYEDGAEVDDPDAQYVKECRHTMFWPFTEEGQLIGEMVYQITPYSVSPIDPDEVPTLDEVESVAEQYYPENVGEESPFHGVV